MDLSIFEERSSRCDGLDNRDTTVLIAEIKRLKDSLKKVQNVAKAQMDRHVVALNVAREAGRKEAGWCYEESAKAIKAEKDGRAHDNADLTAQVIAAESEVVRLTNRLTEYKREAQKYLRREDDLKAARDRAELKVKELESALTRATSEGMEEERERCCRIVDEVASTYCGTIAGNQAAETIAAIRGNSEG